MSKSKNFSSSNQHTLLDFFAGGKTQTKTQNYNVNQLLTSKIDVKSSITDNSTSYSKNERLSLNSNLQTGILRSDCNPLFTGKMYYPYDESLFRKYQFDIVKTSLRENTLVCLPTGLGKTFIASVIMYNFHLWFKGKIFFMAPTKPLVKQQVESFGRLFPTIPTEEITGMQSVKTRNKLYSENKIFFMTPQTLDNDLKKAIVTNQGEISLIVIDEAHKATGNYAYVNIVNKLAELKAIFRVIGLTASPGSNLEAVQKVITALKTTAIELRTEQDPELKKYTYNKRIQIAEIEEEDKQICYKSILDRMLNSRLEVMKKFGVCEKKITINYLTVIFLLKAKEKFKSNRMEFENEYGTAMVSEIYDNFSLMLSLLNSKKLLLNHGVDSFKQNIISLETGLSKKEFSKLSKSQLEEISLSKNKNINNTISKKQSSDQLNEGSKMKTLKKKGKTGNTTMKKTSSKARENLIQSREFQELKYELFERHRSSSDKKNELHPKLKKLMEIIDSNHISLKSQSKAIIFTQFKDSAKEIEDVLNQKIGKSLSFEIFHGQDKNFKQKDQLEIMKRFRDGDTRVLIATSVAEEGLDIGEVDLIICYDMASSSPIRMIQRFGRTGRKRDGVVIVIASKGEEKNKYFQCLHKLKSVNKELKSLSMGFSNCKIKLYTGEGNLAIPEEYTNNVEYFDLKEDIIDNADDFFSELSDEEVDESVNSRYSESEASEKKEIKHSMILDKESDFYRGSRMKTGRKEDLFNTEGDKIEVIIEDFFEEEKKSDLKVEIGEKQPKKKALNFCLNSKFQSAAIQSKNDNHNLNPFNFTNKIDKLDKKEVKPILNPFIERDFSKNYSNNESGQYSVVNRGNNKENTHKKLLLSDLRDENPEFRTTKRKNARNRSIEKSVLNLSNDELMRLFESTVKKQSNDNKENVDPIRSSISKNGLELFTPKNRQLKMFLQKSEENNGKTIWNMLDEDSDLLDKLFESTDKKSKKSKRKYTEAFTDQKLKFQKLS